MDDRPQLIAGVDEAGRGPLAGPVLASAVIFVPGRAVAGVADSKTLSPSRREALAERIREHALCWAIGRAEVEEIDRLNILRASLLAMSRAVAALAQAPDMVLVDGPHAPAVDYQVRAVIAGDATVPAISAASILAKVERDALMRELDRLYPVYGFARHKGYPTAEHLRALAEHGVSPVHRRTFAPVRQILYAG
ncbi:MAG: ribonuclease HII [Candidatus Muproteobacteria bacterium RBG_16_65_31]|uniref:Ribonuclease HII n=2 Tax=Candidatus Muproteobacteria TaxID=1817795 RepID=A0A1F6TIF5_9PROT|nr:MAG: ribonuclease HII [Candidatus Muproteobacteria bacterium RBG_16_65_31]OGI52494.1 MAG: ribonuclease HII [Candidatus Muproteobacteria bacterium RIFCSPHIGHO2_02_FULL_65_16]